jgi:hypothetical protein
MTEKTPSSVRLGSRLRMDLMRSYSSGVMPCLEMISGVIADIVGKDYLTTEDTESTEVKKKIFTGIGV